MKSIRLYIAYLLFTLSGFCKILGKFIITKEKRLTIDTLSLPGWIIMGNQIIKQSIEFNDLFVNGKCLVVETWSMPDEWVIDLKKHKARILKKEMK